jgi:hypothetical protein
VALPILSPSHFDQSDSQLPVHSWFMNTSDEVFRSGTAFALLRVMQSSDPLRITRNNNLEFLIFGFEE